MKKILVQLWQWILKYRKRLIYGALALFIGQICFFGLGEIGVENEVFADDSSQTQASASQAEATKKMTWLQLFYKIIYVCIYPILLVAGKVVDNSLVYGELFGFDAVLWQLWVIVRNIANFGLGLIFIYKIFEFLLKGQKGSDIKKLLVSSLIAGIGIQASWFIMAALIDISTIATYGIGGLPMSVLKTDEENIKYNPYILGNVIYMETEDLDSYHMYLSNQPFLTSGTENHVKFISECETFPYSYDFIGADGSTGHSVEELILAPQMIYYMGYSGSDANKSEVYYPTEKLLCHVGDDVYRFSNLYSEGGSGLDWEVINISTSGDDVKNKQNAYRSSITDLLVVLKGKKTTGDINPYIENGTILQLGDAHAGRLSELGVQYGEDKQYGLDVNNIWMGSGEAQSWHLPHLGDILSGNYAGVFSSLYGSLLNAGSNLRLSSTSDNGIYVKLLNTALSLGHMVAIAIPLLVMVVVLVMRIGILWMIIALSPFVVLLKAFGYDKKIGKDSILRFVQLDNLLGVVFAPVVICFAVSLSTVLVRIINVMNRSKIETGKQDILGGLIQLDIAGLGVNIGKLVGSVIGIAITWFLMWWAVKASELGKTGIVKNIEDLSKSALGSMQVIPVPGKDGKTEYVGVSTVFGGNGQQGIISKMGNKIKNKYENDSNKTLDQLLYGDQAGEDAKKKRGEAYAKGFFNRGINEIQGNDWTKMEIFIGEGNNKMPITFLDKDLSDGQRENIITRINGIEDKNVREAYGSGVPEITIGGKTWSFVKQEEDKDENGKVKTDKNGRKIMKDVYQYVQKKDT